MATPKEEEYTKMLETLVNYNDSNNGPFSNKKIQQAVSRVMSETEEEERDAERNTNHIAMDTISPLHHCTIAPLHHFTITRRYFKRDKFPFHNFTITRIYCKRDKLEAKFFGQYDRKDICI